MSLIKRTFIPPEQSYFLFGPRGTGKTTLIEQIYHKALRIDLLKPQILRPYLARPEYLYEVIEGNPNDKTIVIDEVQKAPELLSVVHDLIETKRQLQFILTGSSSRKLKQLGVNLLAGRAIRCNLHPFMACELGNKFSLNDALHIGLLPLVLDAPAPEQVLQTYIDLYMNEEVRLEGFIRKVEDFARFLEVISFSHASLLQTSNISRECEVKRKTVENYISILEDLLLAFRLPVFSHQATRELIKRNKFYIFDAGVFQALRPKYYGDGDATHLGPALEGLVAQHLRAWNDYSQAHHTLAFWRTKTGVEVDFVVYGVDTFLAIEVKNSDKITPEDLRSLKLFVKDYPQATAVLLYRGNMQLRKEGIWCIPCKKWLRRLQPNKSIHDTLDDN